MPGNRDAGKGCGRGSGGSERVQRPGTPGWALSPWRTIMVGTALVAATSRGLIALLERQQPLFLPHTAPLPEKQLMHRFAFQSSLYSHQNLQWLGLKTADGGCAGSVCPRCGVTGAQRTLPIREAMGSRCLPTSCHHHIPSVSFSPLKVQGLKCCTPLHLNPVSHLLVPALLLRS